MYLIVDQPHKCVGISDKTHDISAMYGKEVVLCSTLIIALLYLWICMQKGWYLSL